MEYAYICGVFFCMVYVVAEQADPYKLSHAINIDSKNDKLSTDGILTKEQSRSKIQCANNCIQSEDCTSFFYNQNSKECQIHGKGLSEESGSFFNISGYKYYKLTGREAATTTQTTEQATTEPVTTAVAAPTIALGDIACSSVNDCGGVDYSECRADGNCGCEAGYSYQRSTGTCELNCVTYGSSFQSFPGKVLWEHYALYREGGYTEESCKQACLDATAYTCVTCDFTTEYNGCHHHVDDSIDRPYEYQNYRRFVHFQRNCA